MRNIMTMIKNFVIDHDIYLGILTEIVFVLALSMIGFVICLVIQR
jgi:O-antigen ligase